MAKSAKKTGDVEGAKASSTVHLRVRSTRIAEIPDGAKLVKGEIPYEGTVFYNGKRYGAGETFECEAKQASQFLELGVVQEASEKPAPVMCKHLFRTDSKVEKVTGFAPIKSVYGGAFEENLNQDDPNNEEF